MDEQRMGTDNTSNGISAILKAFEFAAHKHRDQRRKDRRASPYINHLIAVAEMLWEVGEIRDIDTVVAGILHDTIEDTDTTPSEIEAAFGARVCSIVREVTDDKKLPKDVRKRLQVEHAGGTSVEARSVKLADKVCNVRDTVHAPPADWSLKRRREYIEWAREVTNELRGTNPGLEQYFDEVCEAALERVRRESSENTPGNPPSSPQVV